jgi:uncharacterized protein (TIGR00251 family)
MKIRVKAKPGAREEKVEKLPSEGTEMTFTVAVKEPPVQGKANKAIEKALAKYFGVPEFKVVIVSGHTSRQKIVEIAD